MCHIYATQPIGAKLKEILKVKIFDDVETTKYNVTIKHPGDPKIEFLRCFQ